MSLLREIKLSAAILLVLLSIVPGHALSQDLLWVKQVDITVPGAQLKGMAVDPAGRSIVTGHFSGTVDFNPGPASYLMTASSAEDIYFLSLDSAGNFLWAKRIGGQNMHINAISVDDSGNLYSTGRFTGSVDFNPGPGSFLMTSTFPTLSESFILKLDASGNFLWARQLYGCVGYTLALDPVGNLLLAGGFATTVDFDPGPGTWNLSAVGNIDIFISKLTPSGSLLWAKRMGGDNLDQIISLALDRSGNILSTGFFEDTADFDPGPASYNLVASGPNDIFISKLDPSGNFIWAKKAGGGSIDHGRQIAVDDSNNVFVTGLFLTIADFDPGPSVYQLTSAGNADAYFLKLDSLGNFLWVRSFGGYGIDISSAIDVDPYGNSYASGAFFDVAGFDQAAGGYILNTPAWDIDAFICKFDPTGKLIWARQLGGTGDDGGYFLSIGKSGNIFSSGVFEGTADFDPGPGVDTLTASVLGDIYIHVMSQCQTTTSSISPLACNSYLSPGGSHTWYASGNYVDTIQNISGCDSVIYINLSIISVDTSVSLSSTTLTSNANGASYQWIYCDSVPLSGAIGQQFTPSGNGSYAVIVSAGSCSDTSSCYPVIVSGLEELPGGLTVEVYPNPSEGLLWVYSGNKGKEARICLFDLSGREVISPLTGSDDRQMIDLQHLESGIYLLQVIVEGETAFRKIVITGF